MTASSQRRQLIREMPDGAVTLYTGLTPFTFTLDTVGSLSTCMICRTPAQDAPMTVAGVAAVEIGRCRCGWVVSDSYLIHAGHLPMTDTRLQHHLTRAMNCNILHYRN